MNRLLYGTLCAVLGIITGFAIAIAAQQRPLTPQACEIGSFLLTPQRQVLYCAQANTWTVPK